ncbi:MAG: hypothetical protein HPY59_06215 [Anaerolineae bacterium]|nr:hypothetical protein [Anaerolineae bacterium]
MKNYFLRTVRLVFGLFLFSLGLVLSIQANIGLAPWEAFSMGISNISGISYGKIVIIVGVVIIGVDLLLKEKIGFGTILNSILIGTFVDLLQSARIIPMMSSFWPGLLMLLCGLGLISLASYFYIGSGLGCGPRDALMVALGKRFSRAPIGWIRGLLEGSVLVVGWLLGAKVGLGTVLSVFGIGVILQFTFNVLNFDVTLVKHESVIDTIKAI